MMAAVLAPCGSPRFSSLGVHVARSSFIGFARAGGSAYGVNAGVCFAASTQEFLRVRTSSIEPAEGLPGAPNARQSCRGLR
jgi:hypothetical protein